MRSLPQSLYSQSRHKTCDKGVHLVRDFELQEVARAYRPRKFDLFYLLETGFEMLRISGLGEGRCHPGPNHDEGRLAHCGRRSGGVGGHQADLFDAHVYRRATGLCDRRLD